MSASDAPVGYVLVDANTGAMDWDGVIHPTLADAIREITHGVYKNRYGLDEELERRPDHGQVVPYDIRAVMPVPGVEDRVLAALQAEWDRQNGDDGV